MQSAETVLSVLRERGRRDLPCEELYRQLFNPQLYLVAYGRIYANHGAMTPGGTSETEDGMSQRKIGRIIEEIRHERYRFRPVRRVHIPKKNGETRPLGIPTVVSYCASCGDEWGCGLEVGRFCDVSAVGGLDAGCPGDAPAAGGVLAAGGEAVGEPVVDGVRTD